MLAQLLEPVDTAADTTRPNMPLALEGCRRLEMPALHRPFLTTSDETSTTHGAFEGYRALRTKLVRFQSAQGVRSIVVTSAEAGEGKTVSAVNLALSLAQLPSQRILLVDADLRTYGLSTATGALQAPGLAEVLSGEAAFETVPMATNVANLYIVGAGDAKRPAGDLFSGPRFKEFIGWCNETFSMILVDCPPMIGLADFDVVSSACDGVLLVIRAQRTKRERLTELVPHLRDKKVLGVLFNGQERRRHKSRYGYYYSKMSKDR
ncbi:MAG: CpsD/CapB family tyrosine-protein kinase [Candidatus Korobacteraceae bacterium]